MVDEFREQADSESLFGDNEIFEFEDFDDFDEGFEDYPDTGPSLRDRLAARGPFLGLTAAQRFLISAMLFVLTCIVSSVVLIVFQAVVPF